MSKTKKVLILCGMVALLVLTGCLNFFLNRSGDNVDAGTGDTQKASFFDSTRTSNKATRNEAIAQYEAIIADASSSAEAIAEAEAARKSLVDAMKLENDLETLIKALGFEDAIVSLGNENVNIILKSDELASSEAAQVLQIIVTETDKTASNVRIITVE